MSGDIFCKIISGEFKGDAVYRDDDIIVIRDIHPQAPVHLLVMPLKHVDDIAGTAETLLGKMMKVADRVAREQGLTRGYRLIVNEGDHGGKLVPHVHMHVLGGKHLGAKIVADEATTSPL